MNINSLRIVSQVKTASTSNKEANKTGDQLALKNAPIVNADPELGKIKPMGEP